MTSHRAAHPHHTDQKAPTLIRPARPRARPTGRYRTPLVLGFAAITAAVALTGCGGPDSDLAGQWVGTCSPSPQASILTAPVNLDLRADGSFTATVSRCQPVPDTGTYSTEDDRLTLISTDSKRSEPLSGTGRYTVDDTTLSISGLQTGSDTIWCTLTRR
ncbi:hypothetical protein Ae263Ps1_6274c [Pseudonocardia sp. Ae263_Ps1]|nr:hypothetical protein Ae263Ps1_6274c [Pseudonocardia sp. Ae263_Ps1]OLL89247.1 hypothetical protein Ae356Ps1_6166 [Pseudonocardia sp. Ae356_Ps1]